MHKVFKGHEARSSSSHSSSQPPPFTTLVAISCPWLLSAASPPALALLFSQAFASTCQPPLLPAQPLSPQPKALFGNQSQENLQLLVGTCPGAMTGAGQGKEEIHRGENQAF